MRGALLGSASCAAVLAPTSHLLHHLGPVVVLAAPLLAVGLLAMRRVARGQSLRALLLGASVGLVLLFAYGFSPPVLERIGHAMGWPGQSLRVWEKFAEPVDRYCCSVPWFWDIYVVWDVWTTMAVELPVGPAARFVAGYVPVLAALAAGLVYLRRRRTRSPGDA